MADAGPGRYRPRKPVYLEAIQWTGDNGEAVAAFAGMNWQVENGTGFVWMDGDWHSVSSGTWALKGITGKFFFSAANAFAAIYEPVTEEPRPGEQQLPIPNNGPSMHDLVIADMDGYGWTGPRYEAIRDLLLERKRLGLDRYGSLLQARNGRDWFRDLLEELADGAVYARQGLEELGDDTPEIAVHTYRLILRALTCALRIPEDGRG